jgi:hypothetical protein
MALTGYLFILRLSLVSGAMSVMRTGEGSLMIDGNSFSLLFLQDSWVEGEGKSGTFLYFVLNFFQLVCLSHFSYSPKLGFTAFLVIVFVFIIIAWKLD